MLEVCARVQKQIVRKRNVCAAFIFVLSCCLHSVSLSLYLIVHSILLRDFALDSQKEKSPLFPLDPTRLLEHSMSTHLIPFYTSCNVFCSVVFIFVLSSLSLYRTIVPIRFSFLLPFSSILIANSRCVSILMKCCA